jgi:carboxypeptidase family protein
MIRSASVRRKLSWVFFLLLGLAMASAVSAQEKTTQLKTIRGSVVDKAEKPAPGSVVYLLNTKTQAVKTYIADEGGTFHFSGLDPNADYAVHAEKGNDVSPSRNISSFDSRRDIEVTLKLSKTK